MYFVWNNVPIRSPLSTIYKLAWLFEGVVCSIIKHFMSKAVNRKHTDNYVEVTTFQYNRGTVDKSRNAYKVNCKIEISPIIIMEIFVIPVTLNPLFLFEPFNNYGTHFL